MLTSYFCIPFYNKPTMVQEISNKVLIYSQKQIDSKKSKKESQAPKLIHLDDFSRTLLSEFLDEKVSETKFKTEYFQKYPLVTRSNDISEVKQALSNLDPLELLKHTSSDAIHVWLNRKNEKEGLDSITINDPEQAYKLFLSGHSLYFRAPPSFENKVVKRLSNELNFGIQGCPNDRFRRGEVEVFFSKKGHTTTYHADFQENFTIQLKGKKKWSFQKSTATHPLRGCTPHFNDGNDRDVIEHQIKVLKLGDPNFKGTQYTVGEETDVVLDEGDTLYHPAGIWHQVECLEDSISINISLTAVSYADLFCSSLQQMLMENPYWRSSVFTSTPDNPENQEAHKVMKSILDTLPTVLKSLKPQDFLPNLMLNHQALSNLTTIEDNSDEEQEEEVEGDDDHFKVNKSKSKCGDSENSDDVDEEGWEDVDEADLEEVDVQSMDEEEMEEEDEIIQVDLIDVETLLSQFENAESNENQKKRKKIEPEPHFRFNPFAMFIVDEDLIAASAYLASHEADQTGEDNNIIVHIGYGNETLESASRSQLNYSNDLKPIVNEILHLFTKNREERLAYFISQVEVPNSSLVNDTSKVLSLPFTCKSIATKLPKNTSKEDIWKVLLALHQVGALTLVEAN